MDDFERDSNARGGIVDGVFGKATLNEINKDWFPLKKWLKYNNEFVRYVNF